MESSGNWSEIVSQKDTRIAELEALVKYYEDQLRLSKHRQFGARSEKSEYDFAQISIFDEAEATADENVSEPELIEIEKHYRKWTRLTTDRLPDNLPVEIVEHNLPTEEQICPECCVKQYVVKKKWLIKLEREGFLPLKHPVASAQVDFGDFKYYDSLGWDYEGHALVASFPNAILVGCRCFPTRIRNAC